MATTDHNSVGAGVTPKLGRGKPEGLTGPGGTSSTSGASASGDVTKTRPGGAQSTSGASTSGDTSKTRPGSGNPNSTR